MATIDHIRRGGDVAAPGTPPAVLVHGFACDHSDWAGQIARLSQLTEVVAVDLPGHGKSAATLADASIRALGDALADLLDRLDLAPSLLVGHSMGCRVIVEAARLAPARVAGLALVDGSRLAFPGSGVAAEFAADLADVRTYRATVEGMFAQMFLADADPGLVKRVVERARALPAAFGATLLADLARWDETRFDAAFGAVRVPLWVIQSTYTNPERQRVPLRRGQNTAYFDLLLRLVPEVRIEVVENVGHFPQMERATEVNERLAGILEHLTRAAGSGAPAFP